MEEDIIYVSDEVVDGVVVIADEMVGSAISGGYDRELAKEALDYSVGDLAQAASYLLDRGMSEAGLARFAEAALADIELVEDPRYGEYIQPPISRPITDSPAGEADPIIEIEQDDLAISSVPVFAYDVELAKQALDAGGGDLGLAAEFLMGRGLSAADLEMFAAQALVDEALVNDATYGAFLAPPPMAPIGSDAFGNPLPGNPAYGSMPGLPPADEIASYYDSRFASEEEAIAYAEASGQGALTVAADGIITNQNGEVMVYDSDGNLAPAAIGNLGLNGDPGNPDPVPVFAYDVELAKQALDAGGGDLGLAAEFLMGRGLSAADLEMFAAQALVDEALVNDATYGAFLAPPPMAPIGSDAFGNPLPGNPSNDRAALYDSRFGTEDEAIVYAQASGQGPLTTLADGSIINQYGEVMVYDSSGNLAPAPRAIPVGMIVGEDGQFIDDPNWSSEQAAAEAAANAEIAAQINAQGGFGYDVELAKQALDAGGGDLGLAAEFLMGRGLSAADLEMFAAQALVDEALVNDATYGAFLAPPPMAPIGSDAFGNPLPGNPSNDRAALYDSRFGTEDEAIVYAQASGQGPLTTLADGSIINQYGEVMVYDSSGNLAPAPRAIPVGMIVGEDGQFIDDPNWSSEQAAAEAAANAEIAAQINAQGGFGYDVELAKQALDAGGGDLGLAAEFLMGRGLSAADLEMFAAQALVDEALVNDATYGAFLAPPPMAPIGSDAFGNPLPGNPAYGSMPGLPPADEIESYYDSRFASEEEAIAYAEASGQGALTVAADGTITNQNGEVMVYDSDGNLAPAAIGNLGLNGDPGNPNPMPVYGDPSNPNQGVDPTDRDQVFDSRFGTEEDAIVYAEASGQGPLTTLADGSLINQYGETMVYDSSGNLAPAPRDVPVGMVEGENGQFVDDSDWTAEQAVAEAAANAEIAAQVDAQAAADAAAAQAAADAAAAQAAADAAAAQAAADAAAAQAAADAAAELESDSSSEGSVTNPRLIADVANDLDVVGVSLFDFAGI